MCEWAILSHKGFFNGIFCCSQLEHIFFHPLGTYTVAYFSRVGGLGGGMGKWQPALLMKI